MFRSSFNVVLGLTMVAGLLTGQDPSLLRASQLMKMEVRNAANDTVGEVKDIVLDRQTGAYAYAIVSLRLPGRSGKLFAVPWQALSQTADRKALAVSVSNEALATVPGFDPNNWPDVWDKSYAAKVAAAYGIGWRSEITQPYDEPRVIGTRETVAVAPRATRRGLVVSGNVKALIPGEVSEVVIETNEGDVDAVLAPIGYLDTQRVTLDENANVRVRGYSGVSGDRVLFVATEVMTHPGRWVRLRYDDLTPAWGDVVWGDVVARPWNIRYLAGIVEEAGSGWATILTETEGLKSVAIAPSNYFESRHWRLRKSRLVGVTGYDDPASRQFVAITIDHEDERWRVRWDDGTPLWK